MYTSCSLALICIASLALAGPSLRRLPRFATGTLMPQSSNTSSTDSPSDISGDFINALSGVINTLGPVNVSSAPSGPHGRILPELDAYYSLRTITFDAAAFDNPNTKFNLSVSECARHADIKVGQWTFDDGHTVDEVSWRDIYLNAYNNADSHSISDVSNALANHSSKNVDMLLDGLTPIVEQYICQVNDTNTYTRHLLQLREQFAANFDVFTLLLINGVGTGALAAGFSTLLFDTNAEQNWQIGLVGFLLVYCSAISRFVANGPPNQAERLMAAGAIAYLRAVAVYIFANAPRMVNAGSAAGGGAAGAGETEEELVQCVTQERADEALQQIGLTVAPDLGIDTFESVEGKARDDGHC